jgi:acetylornithine deacetylase
MLHGRGASDAKASVAAMASAAYELERTGGPARGKLVVLATFGEETSRTTMPIAIDRLGQPDAAIIGEPTSLAPCVAQRGLVVLRLHWRGTAGHAGWAAAHPGAADNAVVKAARDIARLTDLRFQIEHSVLGCTAATVTTIEGGSASNVVPDSCVATVDVRTTPAYTPEEVVAEIASRAPWAEIDIVSRRFLPCETPADSRLLPAILAARAAGRPFGSPTASDWVFLRDVDVVKLGPGDSRLSHTNEERISLREVEDAAELYLAVAREYLS